MALEDHASVTRDGVTYIDCGCRFWTQGDAFVVVPCSPNCEVWLFMCECFKENRKSGFVIQQVDAPCDN